MKDEVDFPHLAAQTLLRKLDAQQYANHNKHVVDYLPEQARRDLFDGLQAEATRDVSIKLEGKHNRTLRVVPRGKYELLPFLVTDEEKGGQIANCGTEGFASSLRDFFSEGADSSVNRVLLVLTPAGNETQRSARDSADRDLIGIRAICHELARHFGLQDREATAQIVDAYLAYTQRDRWEIRLARLSDFFGEVRDKEEPEWGGELSRLGCFFADSDPDFLGRRIPALNRNVTDRRIGERNRLRTNGAAFMVMSEVFDDPLQPNTFGGLAKLVDSDTAARASDLGLEKLAKLDFAAVDPPADQKGPTNKFALEDTPAVIEGALAHHWLVSKDGKNRILLVAADDAFTISLPLELEHEPQREHLRLIAWEDGRYSSLDGTCEVSDDGYTVAFDVDCTVDFSVQRVAISKGPRSYKSFHDDFVLVTYRTSAPYLAWEVGAYVSMEHQAWVREGDSASFQVRTPDGETERETILLGSFDYDPSDAPTDSREIDSVITAITEDVLLADGKLTSTICWTESVAEETEDVHRHLETTVYKSRGFSSKNRKRLFNALKTRRREGDRYPDAITDATRDPSGFWNLEVGNSVRLRVDAFNERGQEEAVALLLDDPTFCRVERSGGEMEGLAWPNGLNLDSLSRARVQLFEQLQDKVLRHDDTEGVRSFVSLLLTNLSPFEDLIDDYLNQWNRAIANVIPTDCRFSTVHQALLQLDVVVERNDDDGVERISVLPTHPWVLRSLLSFQKIADQAYQRAKDTTDLQKNHITQEELEQLAATKVLEHWFFEGRHFRAEDGAPFTLEFVPESKYVREARLDYVSRVVRKKIERYLQMHRHLLDARRTLKIGFVNPGQAKHLLDGIYDWLKASRPRDDDDLEYETWLAKTPQIEVLLFDENDKRGERTNAFDRFFREHFDSSNIKDLDQVLLTKLRYGKRRQPHPKTHDDYVHLCFVHGLVREQNRREVQGDVDDGWDGCFADGLMATNVRRTARMSVGGDKLVSQRGLWIGSRKNARRQGLANLLMLLRGARTGEVKPGGSAFVEVELPGLDDLVGMYHHSDWVIHLDRELSLEMFRRWGEEAPKIIEYSDQEDPLSPGFDVITLTQYAEPYYQQLHSVLQYASLTPEHTLTPEQEKMAQKEGEGLLNDINTLSGSWALDFLMGSIAQPTYRTRLVGNVGSALVYRWLRRVEEDAIRERYGDAVVPVYVSLEEIIRATPAAGLQTRYGMKYRYGSDKASKFCDDLLVLYLSPAKEDEEFKLFGRIIEVKFGAGAAGQEAKAIEQVKGTFDLLSEHLSGDRTALEAPFRHRQLSLLIKSQLEQAVSSGILDYSRMEALNLPVLSAKLAAGDYTVDYVLGEDARQVYGDAFLLTTSSEVEPNQIVRRKEGVRIVTLDRNMLHWLAYTNSPTPAHPIPRNTLPDLGQYGATLREVVEGTWKRESTTGGEDSEAGIVVAPPQRDLTDGRSDDQTPSDSLSDDSEGFEADWRSVVATRLGELRTRSSLTQMDVAEATGIAQTTVSKLERCGAPASLESLYRLAELYDISIHHIIPATPSRDALATGEEPPSSEAVSWEEIGDAIGQNLQTLRGISGMAQTEVEAATGIDQTSVSRLENHGSPASLRNLYALADAYDVSLLEILPSRVSFEDLSALHDEDRREPADDSLEEDTSEAYDDTEELVPSKVHPDITLEFASGTAVREVTRDGAVLSDIVGRLADSFKGQGIKLVEPPSIGEIELGPRLLRVYVRLDPSEKIASVRNRSEDIARNIGTATSDIHIVNVPEKRAVALDLPIPGMEYPVNYHHLHEHISFEAAKRELTLGFCAGIDLTGKPIWVDLATMPHMMVAGTTGSGKTVFLRTLILTLIQQHDPLELDVRLSSSKPMDFLSFMEAPHTQRGELATNAAEAAQLVHGLVEEMERRYELMTEVRAINLEKYNRKMAHERDHLPYVVAVIDEFSETVLSFDDSTARKAFENKVSRLAQKARAAGIHLVLCMQRPDADVIKGAIKANILHRFALKLPTKTDSGVILDENGAEALLGKGDLLYKAASGKSLRLQVPYLSDDSLECFLGL